MTDQSITGRENEEYLNIYYNCDYNILILGKPCQDQTLGFPSQFNGLNVARRLNKSPRSQGLHEGLDVPKVEPPALVLKEVHGGCEATQEREAALEPGP